MCRLLPPPRNYALLHSSLMEPVTERYFIDTKRAITLLKKTLYYFIPCTLCYKSVCLTLCVSFVLKHVQRMLCKWANESNLESWPETEGRHGSLHWTTAWGGLYSPLGTSEWRSWPESRWDAGDSHRIWSQLQLQEPQEWLPVYCLQPQKHTHTVDLTGSGMDETPTQKIMQQKQSLPEIYIHSITRHYYLFVQYK